MRPFLLIVLIFLYCSCSSSKYWNGTDIPGIIRAEFKDLNGTQSFDVVAPEKGPQIFLTYTVTVEKGELEMKKSLLLSVS
ncbi:hypothetical protein [Rubrolithibacter danxiaensis]|uniref:hypothetical protein n=1 Tax=Rubrolithibacter danxiaensis TaxID=3390805 RepID=UPI003BF776BD